MSSSLDFQLNGFHFKAKLVVKLLVNPDGYPRQRKFSMHSI